MAQVSLVDEIEDNLGRALMDIDLLISRGVPLSNALARLADDIDRQLLHKDEWVKDA